MVVRLVLGLIYTGMAGGQLASWSSMPDILFAYQVVGGNALWVLAAVLVIGELLCGLWFLARPRSLAVAPVWIYTVVSLIWAGLSVQAFVRGLEVANCGCFGLYLSQRLSWFVLAQDALLLLYAALLFRAVRHSRPAPSIPSDAVSAPKA